RMNVKQRIERIKKQLHSKGYKLTPQREATLTVLLEREEDHLSAEEVFLLVKERAPEIGLATVYRTLELLSELQVVDKINFGDGVSDLKQRIERIKKQLHSKGYKLTPQREATLTVLLEREEDHLSAEEVFLLVKERAPEIGLATVYRTLELLSELQVVDKINFGDGV